MENNRHSSRLKQRLASVFRSPPFLLRFSCNPSTSTPTNLSSTASSRALLHDAVAQPVFVPHSSNLQSRQDQDLHDSFFRLLSLATPNNNGDDNRRRRRAFDLTGGCRPTRSRRLPSVIANNSKWKSSTTRKKERRVRETGGYYETGDDGDGRTCPPASPSSPSKSSTPYYDYCFKNGAPKEEPDEVKTARRKTKRKKKKLASNACGFTSSSSMEMISDDELGFFSTEEEEEEEDGLKEEETETFFTSRSFSSDSSEFYQNPNKKKNNSKKKKKKTKSISDKWGVCNEFQPLVSVTSSSSSSSSEKTEEEEEEIVKKGYAVKKKSSDPYIDFRSSMVEMIIERQIFGGEDLERLLESYLSLNSPRHHPIILQAFSDIWVVLFDH